MDNIENIAAARRARTAQEIRDALRESGMSRKEFADRMHRMPSEVTKWLSGNHNFTTNLLAEISYVLGTAISGAEEKPGSVTRQAKVTGYSRSENGASHLEDPASYCLGDVEIPIQVARSLSIKAERKGSTLREYIKELLCNDSEEVSAADFAGIWTDGYPEYEEIKASRTENRVESW